MKLGDTFSSLSTAVTPFERATGFQQFSYTLPTSGTYTVGFGVVDVTDPGTNSGLLIDNVVLSHPSSSVPEPSTILGILALGAINTSWRLLRRKKGSRSSFGSF